MTVREAFHTAKQLANVTDSLGNTFTQETSDTSSAMLPFVNQIYAEMWRKAFPLLPFVPVAYPEQDILFPDVVVRDVMVYGIAMLLCNRMGDVNGYDTFAVAYNRKLPSVSVCQRKIDVVPKVEEW